MRKRATWDVGWRAHFVMAMKAGGCIVGVLCCAGTGMAQDLPDRPAPAALTVNDASASRESRWSQDVAQSVTAGGGVTVTLTLKRAIEMALTNSKDIQLAKIQTSLADRSAQITKADFLPNVYAGSGAGYTYGIPETPGGRAPSVFNVTYTQEIFNEPLRGQSRELQEQARSQRVALSEVRNSVIARTAMGYLELEKVRHSLTLLRGEKDSAEKILEVTKERQGEGFELPVEVTKAQLTRAQVVQKILQLEGREDELQVFLKGQLGVTDDQEIDLAADDLPGEAEQEGANLVALAMESNTGVQLAESDVRAREFRLQGEKRGYLPTLQVVGIYSYLAKFNNYSEFFNHFQANNLNAGVNILVPI